VKTLANDHVGIRVTDMERSIRFYSEVFGAEAITRPFLMQSEFVDSMFEGPAGISFRFCHLRFDGGLIEVFEFQEPNRHPAEPAHASRGNITHLGFEVDDVDATVARIRANGGRLIFPITQWGDHRLSYTADPDGNVIEIADAPLSVLVEATKAAFPESDLDRPRA
jgi:catechol 2,3-dioxygenase-like lactoylglutathione lyase family enzyme